MCVNIKDCELNKKVDDILKKIDTLEKNQEDLRKDNESFRTLVNTHNEIITKIDTKVQDGVVTGVERALKGLDERVGNIVERKLKDNDYEKMIQEKERKKGFIDHGIKQVIGIAVTGIIGALVIVFQLVNNNDLKEQITTTQSELREQIKTIESQRDIIKEYEAIIKGLQNK